MVETAPSFSEVDAYERFMGRWSRGVAGQFLRWLRAPAQARWLLDVGCGTGILSQMALSTCAPATIVGIDPTPAQVAHSANHVGDARARGIVAAYVWDFEPERSPSGPMRKALGIMGIDVSPLPGTQASTLRALAAMFDQVGLANIVATTIEVTVSFADFQDFWDSQTTSYSPTTKIVTTLSPGERESLVEILRTLVWIQGDGTIQYFARANAVKAEAAAPGYAHREAGTG